MFKVGDKVFSYSLQEWGEVVDNYDDGINRIKVKFKSGTRSFTKGGMYNTNEKAPDLFFDEVSITPPQRPLQDKNIVMCYINNEYEIVYRFYDAKNKHTFSSHGRRGGFPYDSMVYVPDEEAPQELVALRDKLSD